VLWPSAIVGWVGVAGCVVLGACGESPAASDAGIDAPPTAWRLGPTMPRKALEPGVTALGQQVVVVGGFATSLRDGLDITARVSTYDVATEVWDKYPLPDAPVRWTHLNLAAIGVTLYLVGGLEGTQLIARGDSFALDPITQTWGPIAAMPAGEERGAAGVVTAPGRIYLLGGASATQALASCLEYDIIVDAWRALPALPEPRSHPAAMRMVDGTLIVAGGLASLDSSMPRAEVWALPPPGVERRVWTPRTPMPGALHGGCAYGVALGALVCVGGERGTAASNVVHRYNPYLDEWTEGEPMPVDRAGTQGIGVGGRLFVPGGAQTLSFEPTDTLYIYTPLDTAGR
jgi:hypothetical protein